MNPASHSNGRHGRPAARRSSAARLEAIAAVISGACAIISDGDTASPATHPGCFQTMSSRP